MDRVTGDRIDSNENLREEAVDSMMSLTKSDNTDANSESILITPQLEITQQKSFENVFDQNDGTVLCIETKSKVDSIEDIETACCRVCHGESQPDNQLFYPCKCDGSIKYVHQQCLMEWLKVKKRQQQLSKPRCELCGETFVFQNIYAAGAPTCLTTFEIIRELLPRVLSVVSALLNAGLSFFFWCICLPLFTNCIIKVCWCVVTEENEDLGGKTQKECISSSFPTLESFDSFSFAWYNGIVNLCVIVAVTVVCFEVGQVIYREIELAEKSRKIKSLERQLADHVTALQKFEEDRRISESKMFAIADYESLNFQWKSVKKDNETRYLEKKACEMEVFADEIYVIQRYMIDKKFTIKMAEKLTEVSLLLPDFKSAAEFYFNLHALLTAELNKMDGGGLFTRKPSTGFALYPPRCTETQNALQKAVEDAKQRAVVALERLCRPEDLEKLNNTILLKKKSENKILENIYSRDKNKLDTGSVTNSQISVNEISMKGSLGYVLTGPEPSTVAAAEETTLHEDLVDTSVNAPNTQQDVDSSTPVEYMGHLKVSSTSEEIGTVSNLNAEQDIPSSVTDLNPSSTTDANTSTQQLEMSTILAAPNEDRTSRTDNIMEPVLELSGFDSASASNDAVALIATAEDMKPVTSDPEINVDSNPPASHPVNDGDSVIAEDGIQNEPQIAEGGIPAPDNVVAVGAPDDIPNEENLNNGMVVANNPAAQPANRPRLRVNFIGLGNDAQNLDLNFIHLICVFMYISMFVFVLIIMPVYLGRFIFNSYLLSDSVKQTIKDLLLKQLLETDQSVAVIAKFLIYVERADDLISDDKRVVADIMFMKTKAILEIVIGYGVYLMILISIYCSYCFKCIANIEYNFSVVSIVTNQIKIFATGVDAVSKISLLAVLYGVAMPSLLVVLMFKPVYRSVPHPERGEIDSDEPVRAMYCALLYFVSHGVMAHVMAISWELRQLVRKNYLVGFLHTRTEADPAQMSFFAFYDRVLRSGYTDIFKSFLINLILFVPGVLLTVIIPLRMGHFFCGSSEPILFRFKHVVTDMQIPVEMLLSHIFIPFLLEKVQYHKVLRHSLMFILSTAGQYLSLEWILEPESFPDIDFNALENRNAAVVHIPDNTAQNIPALIEDVAAIEPPADIQENQPAEQSAVEINVDEVAAAPQVLPVAEQKAALNTIRDLPWIWRMALLIIFSLFSWSALSSWALHLPLKFGRPLIKLLFDKHAENDIFSFPLGTAVCWLAGFIIRYVYKDMMGVLNMRRILLVVAKWCGIILKIAGVGVLWLLIPPMLAGYLIEALVVIPVRTSINETPIYPFWQSWAIGLIALKVWTRCVMTGMFGDIPLRLQFEHILIRGFIQFDAYSALRHVLLPVTAFLLDMILVPFFYSRLLCMYVDSYLLRTVFVRYSIHGYIAASALWRILRTSYAYIISLHNEIRDSRYLIGTKLSNRASGG